MTTIYRKSAGFLGRITTASTRTRIVFIVLLSILYILLFPWLEQFFGGSTGILSTGPVVTTAWLLGLRAGLGASVIAFTVDLALTATFADHETIGYWLTHGGVLGFGALVLVSVVIGLLRNLSQKVRSELVVRHELEKALQVANSELEARVEERTKQLSHTNDALKSEIAERIRTETALTRSENQLRALTARVESIREDERSRVAHDIHDEFGQTLTGLKFEVAWLQRRLDRITDPALRDSFENRIGLIQSSLDTAIHMVRDISSRLRPAVLDNFGLRAAIEWQATEFQGKTGVVCKVNMPDGDIDIPHECEITVFRILQEALNNVARHAHASQVSIDVNWLGGVVTLEISDDGIGMPADDGDERRGLGLLGMKERAIAAGGMVALTSAPGGGTTVKVSMPAASP